MKPELPDKCKTCNKTCLGDCELYTLREAYFNHPTTLKRIWDIQQEDFTLFGEEGC